MLSWNLPAQLSPADHPHLRARCFRLWQTSFADNCCFGQCCCDAPYWGSFSSSIYLPTSLKLFLLLPSTCWYPLLTLSTPSSLSLLSPLLPLSESLFPFFFLRPLAILVDLDCASYTSLSFWFWLKCDQIEVWSWYRIYSRQFTNL